MPIIGIDTLVYSVSDISSSTRFFDDFGLMRAPDDREGGALTRYRLPEGSHVELRAPGDDVFEGSQVSGDGVHTVVWGVDSQETVDRLAKKVAAHHPVSRAANGSASFVTPFGVKMGLRVFHRASVVNAPDPVNAPGRIDRLNQHRKWRKRAHPKVISHVVFAVDDYVGAANYMRDVLEFRLSDDQVGYGYYLRAAGTNSHHNILLLNSAVSGPDQQGRTSFHHANFGVEDIDELMVGANFMRRRGWPDSHLGLGRHRIDSALFYYLPCVAGGEAEYGADSDAVDDSWVPRTWTVPLFGFATFTQVVPDFLKDEPEWTFRYRTQDGPLDGGGGH